MVRTVHTSVHSIPQRGKIAYPDSSEFTCPIIEFFLIEVPGKRKYRGIYRGEAIDIAGNGIAEKYVSNESEMVTRKELTVEIVEKRQRDQTQSASPSPVFSVPVVSAHTT